MSHQEAPAYSPQRPPSAQQQPSQPSQDRRGLAAGIASIVCAVLAPAVVYVNLLVFVILMIFEKVPPIADVLVVAGVLDLLAIGCGVLAIRRSRRMNAGRITGTIGLCITGSFVLYVLASFLISTFSGTGR